jgi:pimeloyl-ACP methyl ester carboxylesterase
VVRDLRIRSRYGVVAVKDFGGQGAGVVLLHGAGHNVETWNILADELGPDVRVIAVDLPGHGWSYTGTVITWDLCASVVHEAVQAMGIREHVVVGHSWGARVALFYGVRYKCKAILALDGIVGLGEPDYSETDLAELAAKLIEVPPPELWWSSLPFLEAEAGASAISALQERQTVLLPDGKVLARPDLSEYLALQRGCYGPGQKLPTALYSQVPGELIGIFSAHPPGSYPPLAGVADFWRKTVVPACPSAQIMLQDTSQVLHWSCAQQIASVIMTVAEIPSTY